MTDNRDEARERLDAAASYGETMGLSRVEVRTTHLRALLSTEEVGGSDQPQPSVATGHPEQGALLSGWRSMLEEARDLLMERRYGNAARSPAHNARLIIDQLLATPTKGGE